MRGDEVIIAHHDTVIQRDDHVILFLTDRRHVEVVERLFDVPRRKRRMNLLAVQRILGLLLMLFSITMLPPLGVSLYYGDGNWQPFSHAFFALLAVGALIWWPARGTRRELRVRDGFLIVALFWFVLGARRRGAAAADRGSAAVASPTPSSSPSPASRRPARRCSSGLD